MKPMLQRVSRPRHLRRLVGSVQQAFMTCGLVNADFIDLADGDFAAVVIEDRELLVDGIGTPMVQSSFDVSVLEIVAGDVFRRKPGLQKAVRRSLRLPFSATARRTAMPPALAILM